MILLQIFFILACYPVSSESRSKEESPTIAIVGAGIGGSSCAHFLRELFGVNAAIDVYEKGEVGGRLRTVHIGGHEYEAGASIIHPRNEYMVNFTEMLGLHPRDRARLRLGIFDGHQLVVDGSEWKAVLGLQLLWRYGLDIFTINSIVDKLVVDFSNIYTHQKQGKAFSTTEQLVLSMSPKLSKLMSHSVADELRLQGLSESYINEVVRGALRTNYGQSEDIHALVGSIAMAGVQPGLWAVHGGNKKVAEMLLQRSQVHLVKEKVTKVTSRSADSARPLEVVSGSGATKQYDVVVIATPLHSDTSDIDFENFQEKITNFPNVFHRTVATFVKGKINCTMFGIDSEDDLPQALLTSDLNLPFNSIGKQYPVDYVNKHNDDLEKETKVWKVFSPNPLSEGELGQLFLSSEETKVENFLAYPHYDSAAVNLPPFQLAPQLYYINGIEWMASAAEVSIIGARNVALLAYNKWFGLSADTDKAPEKAVEDRSEL